MLNPSYSLPSHYGWSAGVRTASQMESGQLLLVALIKYERTSAGSPPGTGASL